MGEKRDNVPDWCVVLGFRLASRYMPVEDVIEAIMLDVETSGEDHAKRKWEHIAEKEKQ